MNDIKKILIFLNCLTLFAIVIFLINNTWWSLIIAWGMSALGIISNQNLFLNERRNKDDKTPHINSDVSNSENFDDGLTQVAPEEDKRGKGE